jgi:UDP:flavonoid glycosyltransferase YjiC (YdhE family)
VQPRVLFLTSNGAGLGHLTRSMAMARRLPDDVEPVFLTLSQALPVVVAQGFHAEYVASAGYAELNTSTWNRLYAGRLRNVLAIYDPAIVVFDGTFPYGGLRDVIEEQRHRSYVWSRRAMWRPSEDDRALRAAAKFDLIIEPGEFAEEADRGQTVGRRHEVAQVGPITLLDEGELLDRAQAEAGLGLQPGTTNVLVQLGAGNINDIHSDVGQLVERLRGWTDTQIVVAESTIAGAPVPLADGIRRARTYPLSRFTRAFDLTVTATGYNTFHEAVSFGLPALFVPNDRTAVDDQVARAVYAEEVGVGLTWQPRTPDRLDEALGQLADPAVRSSMIARMRELARPNGATAAAHLLTELLEKRLGVLT